jgi:hypothetical protein
MQIFDDMVRTDPAPKQHLESSAYFLNRVHTPYFEAIRQLVEDWFARLDPNAQADVRGRLQDGDDQNFCSAFWELYLHESLLRSGYTVTCHPALPGTDRRPDFLAERADQTFYLEATTCLPKTRGMTAAAENRRSQVYDAIQTIDSPNFFLWVEVELIGETSPPTRALCRKLEYWLSTLDPDAIGRNLEAHSSRDELPTYIWEDHGWRIKFQSIAKSEGSRGKPEVRPIGVYDGAMGVADDVTPIRKALIDKGRAYGEMTIPFVIAIATSFVGPDFEDIQDALYGQPQVVISRRDDTVVQQRRAPDGYWYGGTCWRNQHVSAVLIARDVYPSSATRVVPVLWEHPAPTNPITALPMWGRTVVRDDSLAYVEPQTPVCEAFGLPDPWPVGGGFDPYPAS